jgi:hypothetical protein
MLSQLELGVSDCAIPEANQVEATLVTGISVANNGM